MEKCENCGCGIGELETPYLWNERVVCRTCHARFQPKGGQGKGMRIVAGLAVAVLILGAAAAVGVGGTALWLSRSRTAVVKPEPKSAVVKADISGAVWISRNNGSSDIQRGIEVRLLPLEMSGKALSVKLDKARLDWLNQAKTSRDYAARERTNLPLDEFTEIKASHYDRMAAFEEERAAQIAEVIKKMPETVGVDYGYKVSKSASQFGIPYITPIQTVITTVEGKYAFVDVPAGSYYIHTEIDTPTLYMDWLIPVTISTSGKISQDLYNANASTVHNAR